MKSYKRFSEMQEALLGSKSRLSMEEGAPSQTLENEFLGHISGMYDEEEGDPLSSASPVVLEDYFSLGIFHFGDTSSSPPSPTSSSQNAGLKYHELQQKDSEAGVRRGSKEKFDSLMQEVERSIEIVKNEGPVETAGSKTMSNATETPIVEDTSFPFGEEIHKAILRIEEGPKFDWNPSQHIYTSDESESSEEEEVDGNDIEKPLPETPKCEEVPKSKFSWARSASNSKSPEENEFKVSAKKDSPKRSQKTSSKASQKGSKNRAGNRKLVNTTAQVEIPKSQNGNDSKSSGKQITKVKLFYGDLDDVLRFAVRMDCSYEKLRRNVLNKSSTKFGKKFSWDDHKLYALNIASERVEISSEDVWTGILGRLPKIELCLVRKNEKKEKPAIENTALAAINTSKEDKCKSDIKVVIPARKSSEADIFGIPGKDNDSPPPQRSKSSKSKSDQDTRNLGRNNTGSSSYSIGTKMTLCYTDLDGTLSLRVQRRCSFEEMKNTVYRKTLKKFGHAIEWDHYKLYIINVGSGRFEVASQKEWRIVLAGAKKDYQFSLVRQAVE
ncbi:MAG: hypothetical protein SGCHY_000305 [Lobulomycetales sp.]